LLFFLKAPLGSLHDVKPSARNWLQAARQLGVTASVGNRLVAELLQRLPRDAQIISAQELIVVGLGGLKLASRDLKRTKDRAGWGVFPRQKRKGEGLDGGIKGWLAGCAL
jgi:hypothetical protein